MSMTPINLEEILVVNIAGALMLLVLPFLRMQTRESKHVDDHLFNWMVALALGALVMETVSFLIDGRPGSLNRLLCYFFNGYLFVASAAVGMLWVFYVDFRINRSLKRLRRRILMLTLPCALVVALVVCDFFGAGFIFHITPENVYVRRPLFMIPYAVLFYYYILSIIEALIAVKWRNHVRFFPVHYFILPCVVGTIVQGMHYGISVGWFGVSLAFLLIQMQVQGRNAFVDDLSGLYNRRYYNYFLDRIAGSRKNRTISGVMLDINDFKSINDRFGHLAGDEAIRNLGRILSEVLTEHSTTFRLAGDEFIILSPGFREAQTQQLIESFQQAVEAFNRSAALPYALSVSTGYAIFETSGFDSDRFLHQMDMRMYEAKAAYYSQNGKNRRSSSREASH